MTRTHTNNNKLQLKSAFKPIKAAKSNIELNSIYQYLSLA